MRSRYGEPSDTADDDVERAGAAPLQQTSTGSSSPQPPAENARLYHKNDIRLMCANERLYEAYSELHCLAQGEQGSRGHVCTLHSVWAVQTLLLLTNHNHNCPGEQSSRELPVRVYICVWCKTHNSLSLRVLAEGPVWRVPLRFP